MIGSFGITCTHKSVTQTLLFLMQVCWKKKYINVLCFLCDVPLPNLDNEDPRVKKENELKLDFFKTNLFYIYIAMSCKCIIIDIGNGMAIQK